MVAYDFNCSTPESLSSRLAQSTKGAPGLHKETLSLKKKKERKEKKKKGERGKVSMPTLSCAYIGFVFAESTITDQKLN